MNLFSLSGSGNAKTQPKRNESDLQVRAFISDIHQYLKRRLYSPDAEIIHLSFLDSSTTENSRQTTAAIQLFFQQTVDKLETYKTVLNALHPKNQMFIVGKERTLKILDSIITDCNMFKANAAYYNESRQAQSRKKFLTSTLRDHLAILELYLDKN